MNITCSQCHGPTGPGKQINTKRGPAVVHSCLGSCKNEKGYALGTFAPRAPGAGQATRSSGTTDELLTKILAELVSIRLYINQKTTLAKDPLEQTVGDVPF